MRRLPAAVLALLVCGTLAPLAAATGEEPLPFRRPAGYRVTYRERIADGVEHLRLESARPRHVVEIGLTKPRAGYRVDVRHAGPQSEGPDRHLQGTSDMCGDDCAYATNGDYAIRRPGRVVGHPIGGIVEKGVVLVSPDDRHQQASYTFDGGFTTKRLTWSMRAAGIRVDGKNVVRPRGGLVLYTPDYVRTTGTDGSGAELTLRLGANNLVPNAAPVVATPVAFRRGGNSPVRPGTVVLSASGHDARRLRILWQRRADIELTERLSPDVWASVGGGHILVRDGRRYLRSENASHLTTTHPRTFAGVLKNGTLFHATVDGRDRNEGRSVGMPLDEAVRFFLAMGVREAINMDGGGSTTFVRGGRGVVNNPSDGRERVVTTAVVVVPGRIRLRPKPRAFTPPPRPRPELPAYEPPVYAAPAPPPGTPRAVWVAIANLTLVGTGLAVDWARRGKAVFP